MRYGDLITRSFSISWRYKYLWLLAILGGSDVYGSGGGYSGSYRLPVGGSTSGAPPPSPSDASHQISQFVGDHLALIVTVIVAVLVLALAWFLLSCITTGALVRASAEHDAERPFGLGLAWRTGLHTFGAILGIRLIELLVGVVVLAIFTGLGFLGYLAYAGGQGATLGLVIAVGIGLLLLLIPFGIATGLIFILAIRAMVLEQRGPIAGLSRGLALFFGRLGRVVLAWLIQAGLALGAGIVLSIGLVLVAVVFALPTVAAAMAGGAGAAAAGCVPLGVVWLVLLFISSGILGTYFSTYWTLAFRRLELEAPQPTAYYYRQPPARPAT